MGEALAVETCNHREERTQRQESSVEESKVVAVRAFFACCSVWSEST